MTVVMYCLIAVNEDKVFWVAFPLRLAPCQTWPCLQLRNLTRSLLCYYWLQMVQYSIAFVAQAANTSLLCWIMEGVYIVKRCSGKKNIYSLTLHSLAAVRRAGHNLFRSCEEDGLKRRKVWCYCEQSENKIRECSSQLVCRCLSLMSYIASLRQWEPWTHFMAVFGVKYS